MMASSQSANRSAQSAYADPASDNGCDTFGSGDCSPAEMAANDLFLWEAEITQALPGGTGLVEVDSSVNPTRYAVVVSWDEPTEIDPVSFTLDFQLQTY